MGRLVYAVIACFLAVGVSLGIVFRTTSRSALPPARTALLRRGEGGEEQSTVIRWQQRASDSVDGHDGGGGKDARSIPVEIEGDTVTLCDVDFSGYQQSPSLYPKFKDVVKDATSNCHTVTLDELVIMVDAKRLEGLVKEPAGFVFHESRCGSTLVANMLAAVPANRVYSEAGPPSAVLKRMASEISRNPGDDPRAASHLRAVLGAMSAFEEGSSSSPPRTFFKFQSANSAYIAAITAAFPSTPSVFLYREPIEVMSSHLVTSGPVCLRPRKRSSPVVNGVLGVSEMSELDDLPDEQICAAYMAALRMSALAANAAEKTTPAAMQFLKYESLPEGVTSTSRLFAGIDWSDAERALMASASVPYSKARGDARDFADDSQRKREVATAAMTRWTREYLAQTQSALDAIVERQLSEERKDAGGQPAQLETDDAWDIPYPKVFPLGELLGSWRPDDASEPPGGTPYDTIRRFDFRHFAGTGASAEGLSPEERDAKSARDVADFTDALAFRNAEVPFVLTNVPNVVATRDRWTREYLSKNLAGGGFKTEVATDNRFIYSSGKRGVAKDGGDVFRDGQGNELGELREPSTEIMTFDDWYAHADACNATQCSPSTTHYYLSISAGESRSYHWLTGDLHTLAKQPGGSFFVLYPESNKGMHCRFGMKGVIAAAHYDGKRNFVAMVKGKKRYVLLPPSACPHLGLYPRGHASGRHSAIDWGNPDTETFTTFNSAPALEVVLRAGDVLYIPSYWFHYIVSLETNIQCNSRSLQSARSRGAIAECGFYKD